MGTTMGKGRGNSTVKVAIEEAMKQKEAQKMQTEPEVTVNENDLPLEETGTKSNTSKRQSSVPRTKVNERPATKRRLGGSRPGRDPFWYLKHEGDLELVTSEGFNDALGIKEIKVFDPSDAQWEMGVLANCTIIMEHVTIKGVQVRESTRDDSGSIYVQLQSRSWEKEGQKQYMNDVEISRVLQAQVLSYVDGMLEDAQ